jgi:hypothetical protein
MIELASVERCSQPEVSPIPVATSELASVERCSQPEVSPIDFVASKLTSAHLIGCI